jgi:hypothetical protein
VSLFSTGTFQAGDSRKIKALFHIPTIRVSPMMKHALLTSFIEETSSFTWLRETGHDTNIPFVPYVRCSKRTYQRVIRVQEFHMSVWAPKRTLRREAAVPKYANS